MDIPGRASLYSFFYIIQMHWIFKVSTYKQHHKNIHLRSATEVTCGPQREKTCLSRLERQRRTPACALYCSNMIKRSKICQGKYKELITIFIWLKSKLPEIYLAVKGVN